MLEAFLLKRNVVVQRNGNSSNHKLNLIPSIKVFTLKIKERRSAAIRNAVRVSYAPWITRKEVVYTVYT